MDALALCCHWWGWTWPAVAYAVAGCVVLLGAWWYGWDTDKGGYADGFFLPGTNEWAKDKAQHAALSFLLMLVAGTFAPLGTVAGVTLALGIGWEVQQRYVRHPWPDGQRRGFASWRDVVADTTGIVAGLSVHTLVRLAILWL